MTDIDHEVTGVACDEFCAPECAACDAPPFAGGQGRSAAEVERDGAVIGTLVCWAFFLVVGIFIGAAL